MTNPFHPEAGDTLALVRDGDVVVGAGGAERRAVLHARDPAHPPRDPRPRAAAPPRRRRGGRQRRGDRRAAGRRRLDRVGSGGVAFGASEAREDRMATNLEVLGTIPLFAALSKRQRRKLLGGMRVFDYEPGHAIVRQGDEGETMFVVLDGEARVIRRGRTVGRLLAGDVFGEVSVFDTRPRTATVQTVTADHLSGAAPRRAPEDARRRAARGLGPARVARTSPARRLTSGAQRGEPRAQAFGAHLVDLFARRHARERRRAGGGEAHAGQRRPERGRAFASRRGSARRGPPRRCGRRCATTRPTYPSSVSVGRPVCTPIRTRTSAPAGQACRARARWISTAASMAAPGRAKTARYSSPCASTLNPPLRRTLERICARTSRSTTA